MSADTTLPASVEPFTTTPAEWPVFVPQTPCDPFFGPFLSTLRDSLVPGGSEFGTGLFLFSLAVSIRARMILEIGRNTGFSTFAFASALKFIEQGWDEHASNRQRPDVDYPVFERREPGLLFSIDNAPQKCAHDFIEREGLSKYVRYVDQDSQKCLPTDIYDLMLIDGDHSFHGFINDVKRYTPFLRPGGYFVAHDYYGWWKEGVNGSPIRSACDRICGDVKSLLIDTGYQSFVVFRKESLTYPVPGKENHTSGVMPVVEAPAPAEQNG